MNIYFTSVKGRRDANEDRHNIVLNNLSEIKDDSEKESSNNTVNLFGIYDGHGGTYVSNFLKYKIPSYYCKLENIPPFSEDYHKKLFRCLQKELLKHRNGHCMGSTCLINLIYKYENEIHMNIVNLGDCRLTIIYNDGQSKQITTDHKPDDYVERKRIEKMGGEIYKDSEGTVRVGDLSLSRAFGDGDNAPFISQVPDVYYKKITSNTKYIVMGCDGLWDVIENEELYNLLELYSKNKSNNLAADLANEALLRGTHDNVSVIIIEIN